METVKDSLLQFGAGGCAGLVEVCIMHPLDLVKTRFQIQRGPEDPLRYKSLADCFARIYKTEGFFSFYKGILPPILAETPKRAIKFLFFQRYREIFTSPDVPLPLTFSLAGLCSGLTEGAMITPFEAVKVRLQAERSVTLAQQKSTFQMAQQIINTGGYGTSGILKGLDATLGRHGVWNMVYFGLYHTVRQKYQAPKDPTANFFYRWTVGTIAGTIASLINIPFDVAKSRIQGPQPEPGIVKYKSCFQSISLVYKEEGFLALYKGIVPKIMRLGPSGGIMIVVYESVYEFLKSHF